MAFDIVIKFIYGRDVYGKKHPAFMYSLAANLSNEPINSMFPSGSMKKAIDGLAKVFGGHIGAASVTPPTRQNWSRYSSQDLYRPSEAILAFFGRTFEMTS